MRHPILLFPGLTRDLLKLREIPACAGMRKKEAGMRKKLSYFPVLFGQMFMQEVVVFLVIEHQFVVGAFVAFSLAVYI